MIPAAVVAAGLAGALAALYVTWRVRYRYPPAGLPQVLGFHKISRRPCWEGTWTTPGRFFAIVDALRARGYRFIDEDAYLAALDGRAGGAGVPGDREILLTFDDGYAVIGGEVLDGLTRRGIPVHVFVVTDYAGRDNDWDLSLGRRPFRHLSWEEMRAMVRVGVTFGSHTATHPDLTRVPPGGVADELRRSRAAIEDELGVRVRSLSYPFGRYNAAVAAAARAAGYEAAFSLYPRHANERVDRWALRRNGVYVIDGPRSVTRKLERGRLFWFEEMKGRAINATALLTPLFKRARRVPDS